MSNDLNRFMMIGRLTREPELKYTPSGTAVCNFSVANGRKFNDKEETSFFNCIAWGKLGELVNQYCDKGSLVGIEGRLQQRSYEDKDGNKRSVVEVVSENVQFLTPKGDVNSQQPSSDVNSQQSPVDNPFDDSEITF